jgi:hypothetical protein
MFWFFTRIGGNEIPKRTLPDDEDLDLKFPPLVRRQARVVPKKEADNVKLPGLGKGHKKEDDGSRGRATWSASGDARARLAPGMYGASTEAAYRPTSRERLSPVLGIPSPVGSPTFVSTKQVCV